MDIKGIITLEFAEKEDGIGSEIHLGFTDVFRMQSVEQQKNMLDNYLASLGSAIKIEMDDRERQGMLMIQQIMEQLYPHIIAGEMDLDEVLIIEVQPNAQMNFNKQMNP
ncbi:MAG TPA: hypothetical protein DDW55_13370 [Gammaproteobacteria bacterium]|nr:hypothetical protein [Gammaproteobacteria bacterium]